MRFRVRFVITGLLLQAFAATLYAAASNASANVLSTARQQYGDAMEAIDKGRWTEYEQLRPGLEDYPLAIYLDYFHLSSRPQRVRPAEARRFINDSADSPLPNRFLSIYLRQAGRDRRWDDFLAVKPDPPNSIELQCYYYRALLSQGDTLAAWEGAERLWTYGKSRPKQCDPLFNAWLKADQLSDETVWQRLLLAFDARQRSLMTYVARKGSDQLRPWSDQLLAIYIKPEILRRQPLPSNSPYSLDIATHGLTHLARYSPEKALDAWQYFQGQLEFESEQMRQVEYGIARNGLFARSDGLRDWLPGALARLMDDTLVEIRLRWALEENDWQGLQVYVSLLSSQRRDEQNWRYWSAVAREQMGEAARAQAEYESLSTERGFYAFLAADRLGKPYAFNHQALVLKEAGNPQLLQLPAVKRIGELQHHQKRDLAHSEWYKVLQDTPDAGEKQQLAVMAHQQGWYDLAINAANRAKAWDALDLRFPTLYTETFSRYGKAHSLPSTELMAIARRESAFYPEAISPVGARGLMQIMPATGKQVASKIGRPHSTAALYEVEHNVLLGSTYYRQLLDRFKGNRVLALAAYNAGPHRVDRWRNEAADSQPVEVWIETIPFRETRNYVQAVLSYNVVFQYMMGDDALSVLSLTERQTRY